jgi:hypothetical protein
VGQNIAPFLNITSKKLKNPNENINLNDLKITKKNSIVLIIVEF